MQCGLSWNLMRLKREIYDMNLFDKAAKRAQRDAQFPNDLATARVLGKRLVAKANSSY